jgi:hypothetical protein
MHNTIKFLGGYIMISTNNNISRIYGLIMRDGQQIKSRNMSLLGVKRWISANMKN